MIHVISLLGSRAVEHIDTRFIVFRLLFFSRRFLSARWGNGPINKFLVVCTDLLKCEHFPTALYGRNQSFFRTLFFISLRIFFSVITAMMLTCKLSVLQKKEAVLTTDAPHHCTVELWLLALMLQAILWVFFFHCT